MNELIEVEVTYRRDAGGSWLVRMSKDERAHTYGRTIADARTNILEVIELWLSVQEDRDLDDSRRYKLVETFDLGDETDDVAAVRADRAALAVIAERLADHTSSVARRLTDLGISRRDAAEMLGISYQRVQQLVKG